MMQHTESRNYLLSRFRHGYGKHNPRKMVRTWAEKEMSNLFRLYNCGLPVPQPIVLRSHVLVMKFLGTASVPAPRLKVILFLIERIYCLRTLLISWKFPFSACSLFKFEQPDNIIVCSFGSQLRVWGFKFLAR